MNLQVNPPFLVFQAARELLADPYSWAQGARARMASGRPCEPWDAGASSWSLNGAVGRLSNPLGIAPPGILRILDGICAREHFSYMLWPEVGDLHVPGTEIWTSCDQFNDECTHDWLLYLLDLAIQACAIPAVVHTPEHGV